jgi:hypothetical protein
MVKMMESMREWMNFPLKPKVKYACSLFDKWHSKNCSPTTWELVPPLEKLG